MRTITQVKYQSGTAYPDLVIGETFANAIDDVLQPLEDEIVAMDGWVRLYVNNIDLKVSFDKVTPRLRISIQKLLMKEGLMF